MFISAISILHMDNQLAKHCTNLQSTVPTCKALYNRNRIIVLAPIIIYCPEDKNWRDSRLLARHGTTIRLANVTPTSVAHVHRIVCLILITPHRACAARGKVIVDMDSANYYFNSISEIHFNTGKLSSELMASRLQHSFAA